MKAENTTTDHNRTIRLTEIPGDVPEMLITINYVVGRDTNMGMMGVAIDREVIPRILDAINDPSGYTLNRIVERRKARGAYVSLRACIANGVHLKDCDDDGFCNSCGRQEDMQCPYCGAPLFSDNYVSGEECDHCRPDQKPN